MRAFLCTAVLSALAAIAAEAQVCTANAPFTAGSYQVAGSAEVTDGAQAFAGGFSVGSPAGAFGGIGIGSVSYDDLDGSSFIIGGGVGYQVSLGATGAVQVCPVARVDFSFGPNDIEGTGIDASSRSFLFGVSLGGMLSSSPQFQVIPAGSLSFVYSSAKLDDGVDSITESETYGIGSFGVGFVLNGVLTFQPGISIPFGLDESDPIYGVAVALSFGQRR